MIFYTHKDKGPISRGELFGRGKRGEGTITVAGFLPCQEVAVGRSDAAAGGDAPLARGNARLGVEKAEPGDVHESRVANHSKRV